MPVSQGSRDVFPLGLRGSAALPHDSAPSSSFCVPPPPEHENSLREVNIPDPIMDELFQMLEEHRAKCLGPI